MYVSFTISSTRLDINQAALNQFLSGPTGEVARFLQRGGRRVVLAAKAQVGKDTLALMDSISYDVSTIGTVPTLTVKSDSEIAYIHHEGTRPHVITPRNAQALRYSSNGRISYARAVMHPGTPPNRYLSDNIHLAVL